MGFQYGGPAGPKNYYIFFRSAQEKSTPHDLSSERTVTWWEEQVPKQRFTRAYEREEEEEDDDDPYRIPPPPVYQWTWPSDPMLSSQTHLVDPSQVPSGPSFTGGPLNINVLPVWQQTGIKGRGINIGIVDDGVQYTHPDLYANWNEDSSYDFSFSDSSPLPFEYDSHGTSAAGLAVATRDTDCGVGVAYGANFSALRILGGNPTDAIEASALSYHCHYNPRDPIGSMIHIYSNSWGPSDDGISPTLPGTLAQLAIKECVTEGRNGKGSVYLWAGGNGRQNGDNIAWDGYASSRYVIPVGAVDEHGIAAYYSEPGAALMAVVPSSSRYTGITTTDLQGYSGDSITDCTTRFGGTSACSPIAAGVVALMLEANPELGWRDIKHIIVHTSKPVDVESNRGEWQINAADLPHSHSYGFGLLDAKAAVDMALVWESVGQENTVSSPEIHPNMEVPRSSGGYRVKSTSWFADYENYNRMFYIEHVELQVRLTTPNGHGMTALQLCSPWGTCSTMYGPGPGRKPALNWNFRSVRHWGEDIINREAQREIVNPTLEGKSNRADERDAHEPNEWRVKIMNIETNPSEPVVLDQYKIIFYGVYIS